MILELANLENEKTHFKLDALLKPSKLFLQRDAEDLIPKSFINSSILINTEKFPNRTA